MLPEPMRPMAVYKAFISYRIQDGVKLPVDPATGQVCNAHDRNLWQTAEYVESRGLPLAFVLSDLDPYFCLDIDDCITPDGQWSHTAILFCQLLTGCAIEISQSGTGLHIWGRMPALIAHGCRCGAMGCELYTDKRFIALTGDGAMGWADHTPDLEVWADMISEYFPPSATGTAGSAGDGWTEQAHTTWDGPEDDDELIRRMLKARESARVVLGAAASITELWNADADALSKAYPGSTGAFDWSAADAALCQHLAFWTGGDCDRMERVFSQSALADRDKWTARADYRRRTILRAAGLCEKYYRQPGADTVLPVVNSAPADLAVREGLQYLDPAAQIKLFDGCIYVRDAHRVFTPDGGLLKPDQFRAVYGGYLYAMDSLGDKTTRNAWEVFTESQALRFPRALGTVFRPESEPGSIVDVAGDPHVNSYVPVITPQADGDAGPFLGLLAKILPDSGDQGIVLAYMAACVQHIGVKFQWCPLLQGAPGNGKSFLGECLIQAVGEKYSHMPDAKDLANVFNAWLCGNLLIVIEEIYTRDRINTVETLKWMITNRRVPVQAKGRDQVTGDNRANFIMCTNHKDAIHKTKDDRRFCVFYTAQQTVLDINQCGMGGSYFPRLYDWARGGGYAIVNKYLREYAIPDALNPATECHRAPVTTSTGAALVQSLGPVEQLILEAIAEGRPGFCSGWLSSIAVSKLLDARSIKISIRLRGEIIGELGFHPHPGLPGGRVNSAIQFEGGKPRIYITAGHISANIVDPVAVRLRYMERQGYVVATGEAGRGATGTQSN